MCISTKWSHENCSACPCGLRVHVHIAFFFLFLSASVFCQLFPMTRECMPMSSFVLSASSWKHLNFSETCCRSYSSNRSYIRCRIWLSTVTLITKKMEEKLVLVLSGYPELFGHWMLLVNVIRFLSPCCELVVLCRQPSVNIVLR